MLIGIFGVVLPIYKGKGDPMECGPYRGIKLLEHAMKVVERIFEHRIRQQIKIDDMQLLRKDDDDWVKKCMEHEVEGPRPRGRPKKTWKEVVREDCQARKLNKGDAMDRCKWRKMIKEAR